MRGGCAAIAPGCFGPQPGRPVAGLARPSAGGPAGHGGPGADLPTAPLRAAIKARAHHREGRHGGEPGAQPGPEFRNQGRPGSRFRRLGRKRLARQTINCRLYENPTRCLQSLLALCSVINRQWLIGCSRRIPATLQDVLVRLRPAFLRRTNPAALTKFLSPVQNSRNPTAPR